MAEKNRVTAVSQQRRNDSPAIAVVGGQRVNTKGAFLRSCCREMVPQQMAEAIRFSLTFHNVASPAHCFHCYARILHLSAFPCR